MPEDNVDLLSDAKQADDSIQDAPSANKDGEDANNNQPLSLKDHLSEELKSNESIDKFKDVNAITKGYIELEKLAHSKLEDLNEDDIKTMNSKFNVPESLEGYEFEENDVELVKQLREILVESKVSKVQAKEFDKILGKTLEDDAKITTFDNQQSLEKGKAELEQEWGFAYKNNISITNEVLLDNNNAEEMEYFKEKGYTSDPKFLKFCKRVAAKLGEDQLLERKRVRKYGLEPSQIQGEIEKIESRFPLDGGALYLPENKATLDRYDQLFVLQAQTENKQR